MHTSFIQVLHKPFDRSSKMIQLLEEKATTDNIRVTSDPTAITLKQILLLLLYMMHYHLNETKAQDM